MSFRDLSLSDEVLRALDEAGYKEPTPIQTQAIPAALQGRDILGIAQTGTGKTAAFTLPMIDILGAGRARARMPRSLILEPTRELAAQVADSFEKYGKYHKLSKALLIGGVSFGDQEKLLDRGVDVLIATPGRLLDHFQRGKVLLNGVDVLVIDEADRMLDMGFIPDIERLMSLITQRHQTLFFSATMPSEIKRLTDRFLTNPKVIEVARPATAAATVEQALVFVNGRDREKRAKLRDLIRAETVQNAIIFCNRKRDVQVVFRSLERHEFSVGQLHGDMDQSSRMETLAKFKNNEIQLLVASDVAARGLDIPAVSHVFNFDPPTHADDYVHRIGRTGRAGRAGKAFTLTTSEDRKLVSAIEKLLGMPIPPSTTSDQAGAAPAPGVDAEAGGERRARKGRDRKPRERRDAKPQDDKPREVKPREDKPKAETVQPVPSQPEKARDDKPRSERPQNARQSDRRNDRPDEQRAARPDRFQDRNRNDKPQNPRHRRRDEEDDVSVVGFGDNVPAFLQRAPRSA
ncbi:DEAD/DEAH box helicase [Govanella unica]|uniref:DEAD-box ATP-dependent RNA helicase RhpA n=1 Tax=Govanella unica TaxID=2975056 RepID=A0A9X3Z703_9PROT|nr:DEAD/DEAH box helicase [Govania unica]MDA5193563.1 DEAD/DEAH box helicase [Govania unica]